MPSEREIAELILRACAPCCGGAGSGSGGSTPADTRIECEEFNCLLGNAGAGRVLTLSVTGCTLGTQTPPDGVTNGEAISCDNVCYDDGFGDWKYDEHDVSIQAGCVLGGDDLLTWDLPGYCVGGLSLGFCCIDRDDGSSYITCSALLQLNDGTTGYGYVYKTRDFNISTDGTYTYILFTGLAPYQSTAGETCCTNPTINMSLKLTVDGALCL